MPLKKAKMPVRNQVELCAKRDLIALQSFGQECPRSILNKFPLTVFIFQRTSVRPNIRKKRGFMKLLPAN
jgi:hypothetical protein